MSKRLQIADKQLKAFMGSRQPARGGVIRTSGLQGVPLSSVVAAGGSSGGGASSSGGTGGGAAEAAGFGPLYRRLSSAAVSDGGGGSAGGAAGMPGLGSGAGTPLRGMSGGGLASMPSHIGQLPAAQQRYESTVLQRVELDKLLAIADSARFIGGDVKVRALLRGRKHCARACVCMCPFPSGEGMRQCSVGGWS